MIIGSSLKEAVLIALLVKKWKNITYQVNYRKEHPEKARASQKASQAKHKEKRTADSKNYRENNKEKLKARRLAYRSENKEHVKQIRAQYYLNNQEKIKATSKKYREEHPETCKLAVKRYRENNIDYIKGLNRKWYINNKEKANQSNKAYRKINKCNIYLWNKQYRKDNLEACRLTERAARLRRRSRLLQSEGYFTPKEELQILQDQNYACVYCDADLNLVGYHADHLVPLSKGGSSWCDNIQMLCPTCNLSKGAKLPWDYENEIGFVRGDIELFNNFRLYNTPYIMTYAEIEQYHETTINKLN